MSTHNTCSDMSVPVDIEVREAGMQEVRMANGRDLGGADYPYIHLFEMAHATKTNGIYVDGRLAGYAISATYAEDESGRNIGEIGMQHIAQEMRGLGLGGLLNFVAKRELLKDNPDALRSMVGDGDGKIVHLLEEQGFSQVGVSDGAGRHPVWERELDGEHQVLANGFDHEIAKRSSLVKNNAALLREKVKLFDRDDPLKDDVLSVVKERLFAVPVSENPGAAPEYYGYIGAKARIARSIYTEGYGYSGFMFLRGVSEEAASSSVERLGLSDRFKVGTSYSNPETTISGNATIDGSRVASDIKSLAAIVNDIKSAGLFEQDKEILGRVLYKF